MRNKILAVIAVFVPVLVFAQRVETWLPASVVVQDVLLHRLDNGNCSAIATASVTKTIVLVDGGTLSETRIIPSEAKTLAGANLTTCLDILDTKAPKLFKDDKGL